MGRFLRLTYRAVENVKQLQKGVGKKVCHFLEQNQDCRHVYISDTHAKLSRNLQKENALMIPQDLLGGYPDGMGFAFVECRAL